MEPMNNFVQCNSGTFYYLIYLFLLFFFPTLSITFQLLLLIEYFIQKHFLIVNY